MDALECPIHFELPNVPLPLMLTGVVLGIAVSAVLPLTVVLPWNVPDKVTPK